MKGPQNYSVGGLDFYDTNGDEGEDEQEYRQVADSLYKYRANPALTTEEQRTVLEAWATSLTKHPCVRDGRTFRVYVEMLCGKPILLTNANRFTLDLRRFKKSPLPQGKSCELVYLGY